MFPSTPASFSHLPLELILCIGSFLDDSSLRSLRGTCRSCCKTFTPMAFRTFFVRHRAFGFKERIAHLKNDDETDLEPAFRDIVKHARILRIEMGDSIVHQAEMIWRALRTLPQSKSMRKLELVLSASPQVYTGTLYAFSALVRQASSSIPILPFDEVAVFDLARPEITLAGTKDAFELSLVGSKSYIGAPRWLSVCPPRTTSLRMSRVIIDVDLMQGLYHMISELRDIHISDCLVDLDGNFRKVLSWSFLWQTAEHSGRMRSVNVSGCGYRRFPCHSYDEHALMVQQKQDTEALKSLEESVRAHVAVRD